MTTRSTSPAASSCVVAAGGGVAGRHGALRPPAAPTTQPGKQRRAFWQRLLVCGSLACVSLTWAHPASAETYRRTVSWSGYTWKVRLAQRENPGNNTWGDSPQNVRVRSDGSLRLAITTGSRWRSVELAATRRLGYGRYRWVLHSDLSNPSNVLALFVRDMAVPASRGEQDVEFSRWNHAELHPGWFVSWSGSTKTFSSFPTTSRAPYVVEITLRRRSVRFFMRDAGATVLLDRTARGRTTGTLLEPRMSYWLLPGSPRDAPPPPVILDSFHFTRL